MRPLWPHEAVDVGECGSGNCGWVTAVVLQFGPGGGAAWSARKGKRHLPFRLVAQGGVRWRWQGSSVDRADDVHEVRRQSRAR
jgi:hypothetical protein